MSGSGASTGTFVSIEASTATAPRNPTVAIAGVFASVVLAFLALGMVLPLLPRFIERELGGSVFAVGVVIGSYAITGIAGRVLAGRVADQRGPKIVLVFGTAAMSAGGFLLLLPFGIAGLVFARLVVGFGDACVYVSSASWAVDVAPVERRGQVLGLFGLAIWVGLSGGAPLGDLIYTLAGYEVSWLVAGVLPLLGAGVALAMRQPVRHTEAPERRTWFPRVAVRPGLAMLCGTFGFAAVASLLVLLVEGQGLGAATIPLTAFPIAVILTRVIGGRIPDRIGAEPTAIGAACIEAVGLAIIALAGSLALSTLGAVVLGVGFALLFPSLALQVVDSAGEGQRAAALGAFTVFFDLGVGLGGPAVGAFAALTSNDSAFWLAALFALFSAALTFTRFARRRRI